MKTYITFGQIHVHNINGKILDKDSVAVINHNDKPGEGRRLAFAYFGPKFHNEYPEDRWNKEKLIYFPRGLIEVN